jgi:beta-N-acetylhexosaminidase
VSPLVGGIILFTRNYANPQQLAALTRHTCPTSAAIADCGRPRRGQGAALSRWFYPTAAMATLGRLWDEQMRSGACSAARQVGYVLAAELRARGVDYSFTPVLDLDYGPSRVIGDRAFHRLPEAVIALAGRLARACVMAAWASCGKHYPGHGYVIPDSHVELPVDDRAFEAMQEDIEPYRSTGPRWGHGRARDLRLHGLQYCCIFK